MEVNAHVRDLFKAAFPTQRAVEESPHAGLPQPSARAGGLAAASSTGWRTTTQPVDEAARALPRRNARFLRLARFLLGPPQAASPFLLDLKNPLPPSTTLAGRREVGNKIMIILWSRFDEDRVCLKVIVFKILTVCVHGINSCSWM